MVSKAAPGFIQRLAAILSWEQSDGNLLPDFRLITISGGVQPRPKYWLNKDDIWKQRRSTVCGWVNGIKWCSWSRLQSLKFSIVTEQKSSAWGGAELRFYPWVLFVEILSLWDFPSFFLSPRFSVSHWWQKDELRSVLWTYFISPSIFVTQRRMRLHRGGNQWQAQIQKKTLVFPILKNN